MVCLDERKKTLAFTHFSKKQHRDVKETLKIRAYKSVFSHLWGSCHLTAQNAVNLCSIFKRAMLSHVLGILQQETTLQIETRRRCGLVCVKASVRKASVCKRVCVKAPHQQHSSSYFLVCYLLVSSLQLSFGAFAQRSLYTEQLLDTEAFTHRGFYTEKSLYRLAFTRRSFCTERSLYTEELLHTEAFTQRSRYTKEILHTNAFTQSSFYTQKLLHREDYTESFYTQTRLHTEAFTQRSLCTQELLHTRAFTHRSCYIQTLLHKEAFTQRALTHGSFHKQKFYTEAFTQRSFYTQKLFHTEAFKQRSLYTEELLHTRAFTHRSCNTQTLIHKEAFTQRALSHRRVYTQKLFHREVFAQRAFTHGSFYTEKSLHRELLHTEVFTHRSFYAEKPLHRETFTHRRVYIQKFLHREAFAQRIFCTQKLLHAEAVTQRSLYTEALLHEVEKWNWQQFSRKNPLQELSRNKPSPLAPRKKTPISNKVPIPWFHEYVQKSIRNMFLRQVLIQQLSSPPCDEIKGQIIRRSRRWASARHRCGWELVASPLPPNFSQNPSLWWCFHVFSGSGVGKKDAKITRCFLEALHFGHFVADVCYFFGACQEPKHCNLPCFCVFGMEEVLLATCWKLRKYQCFG